MTTTDHKISYIWATRPMCTCDMSVRYTEAGITRHLLGAGRDEGRRERESLAAADWQDGYDVGLAAAKGEPVAADDPRIKPGARVRLEFDSANGVTAHEGVAAGWLVRSATRVYLLAEAPEAPDPDAEVREALAKAATWLADCNINEILTGLRALNYDVVKAVAK